MLPPAWLPDGIKARIVVAWHSGCWVWRGRVTPDGYGKLSGKLAHRVVWERMRGPIEAGMTLDHACRNRSCVNPGHFEPMSHLDNVRRGTTATKPRCKNGHPFDEANTYIRPASGHRDCRACNRANVRRYKQSLRIA